MPAAPVLGAATPGVLYPLAWSRRADAAAPPWWSQTECLLEAAPEVVLRIELRFVQVVARALARPGARGLEPADALERGAERIRPGEEGRVRAVRIGGLPLGALGVPRRIGFAVPAGCAEEVVTGAGGARGVVVRSWRALRGRVEVCAARLAPGLYRVHARIENTTPSCDTPDAAAGAAFGWTHALLRVHGGGRFVSHAHPPERLRARAGACRNVGSWPVLLGEPHERQRVLSSPIVLPDHPRAAPGALGAELRAPRLAPVRAGAPLRPSACARRSTG